MNTYHNVDDYLEQFSGTTRSKLDDIRNIIRATAPEAVEKISYGIPTFEYHGNLVHFAGYKTHIGFYPGSGPIKEFANELSSYDTAKGTIRFPLDKPLPTKLIAKIVTYRIKQNSAK